MGASMLPWAVTKLAGSCLGMAWTCGPSVIRHSGNSPARGMGIPPTFGGVERRMTMATAKKPAKKPAAPKAGAAKKPAAKGAKKK